MIDGSFDSEDAEFDPERNSLYVGATLSQSLRDRVVGIVPDSSGEDAGGTVKMDRIYDLTSKLRSVITGTDAFRISGRNLTVPDAEDESLALYAKDGVTKVTDIVVSETDGGQLITCQLSAAVGVPKGTYKVRLASHGLDPTDPLTVATLTVTLVEAIPAPSKPKVSIRDLKLYGVGEDSSQLEVSAENAEGITGYWADEGGGESFYADVKVGDGETERRMFTRTAGSTGFGASCDPIASGDTVTVTAKIDPAKAAEYDPSVMELSKTA